MLCDTIKKLMKFVLTASIPERDFRHIFSYKSNKENKNNFLKNYIKLLSNFKNYFIVDFLDGKIE